MATPFDPILPAIERDRIAYVAFALLNKTDGRKPAQKKGREVTQAMRMLTKPQRRPGDAVGELRDDGVWRQS